MTVTVKQFCSAGDFVVSHLRHEPDEPVVAVDGNLAEAKVTVAYDEHGRYHTVVVELDYSPPPTKKKRKKA